MFDLRKNLALRHAVASQLIGHDHPRHILQALQDSAKEALGGVGIPPLLHENVVYNTILIHCAPEVARSRSSIALNSAVPRHIARSELTREASRLIGLTNSAFLLAVYL
jgi:hypothetical protein